jgi:hypothetical protein
VSIQCYYWIFSKPDRSSPFQAYRPLSAPSRVYCYGWNFVSVQVSKIVTLRQVASAVLKMSTIPHNPSGLHGGSDKFSQGNRHGQALPQPLDEEMNKNKNKNMTIPSFFAVAPAKNQVVSPPADNTPPSPSPDLVPPIANESNPTNMEEDDISDDATVVTSGTGRSRPATPIGQPLVREITLKFLMQSTSNLATPIVASQFLHLLHAITNVDAPNTNQILDQYSKPLTNFDLDTVAKFEEFLPIDTIPAKPDYKKTASYWIIFRVRTQLTLSAIRKNPLVSNVIQETKGRLSSYPWPTDDRDIVSIGFMIGAIPKYQTLPPLRKKLRPRSPKHARQKGFQNLNVPPHEFQYNGKAVLQSHAKHLMSMCAVKTRKSLHNLSPKLSQQYRSNHHVVPQPI